MTVYFNSLGNNGHLGNQMFQLASLIGIANRMGTDWRVPPKSQFGKSYNLRSNIYDCFNINPKTEINCDVPTFNETRHGYDEDFIFNLPLNCNINGYFQSPKYFNRVDIFSLFSFKESVVESAKIDELPNNYCAMHIRRTDYVGNSLYHTNLRTDYYKKAIELIGAENIVIFSDDPEWCRNHSFYSKFIISNRNQYEDLFLISKANSHIIANSSFSWWGAYLAKSKHVVAPKDWFGPALYHLNTQDYYLNGWLTV